METISISQWGIARHRLWFAIQHVFPPTEVYTPPLLFCANCFLVALLVIHSGIVDSIAWYSQQCSYCPFIYEYAKKKGNVGAAQSQFGVGVQASAFSDYEQNNADESNAVNAAANIEFGASMLYPSS